jgi:hypothetical protein
MRAIKEFRDLKGNNKESPPPLHPTLAALTMELVKDSPDLVMIR